MQRIPFEQTGYRHKFDSPEAVRAYAEQHAGLMARFARRFARKLREGRRPVARLLDVGCGPGTLCIELARRLPDVRITGADLSEPMLDLAHEQARAAGLDGRLSFEHADATALPFQDDAFDAVVSVDTLNCLPDPPALLPECARVTAVGGAVSVAAPRRTALGYLIRIFRTGFTPAEMTRMAVDAGFTSPRVEAGLMFVTLQARAG